MISVATLVAAGIGPTQARAFEAPLQQACELFDLSSPQRQAAFVAEYAYETGGFIHLEEGMLYRDPIRITQIFKSAFRVEVDALAARLRVVNVDLPMVEAQAHAAKSVAGPYVGNAEALANRAYALRNGNGSISSGDGWKFRGRGLPMLTGRANYTAAAIDLGEPYVEQPDLVAQPPDAVLVAGWYWKRYRLNVMADLADIDGITRMINGSGMLGAKERRDLFQRALQAFT